MTTLTRAGLILGLTTLTAATHASVFTPSRTIDRPAHDGGYAFQPVLDIGGEYADEDAQFYEKVGSILVDADADGNLYVLDNGNARVYRILP